MLFPTATFAVFFLIVLPVSWLLMPSQRAWRVWILLASYVFYGWWDWRFVFLLVASTVVNHVLALAIYRARAVRLAQGVPDAGRRIRPRVPRVLQVRGLLRQLVRQRRRDVVDRHRRAAGRNLLLQLHGDLVRRRHLSRRARAGVVLALRRLPGVLPASRRRPDRASERAAAAARVAPRPAPRRHVARVRADPQRALSQGGDREPPRDAHRRRGLRRTGQPLVARGARRRSTATPSRSSPTSAATRTSQSGSRCSSGSSSRRTSTRRTRPSRSRTSGAAGT